jgi:hypothetical protein
LKLENTENQTIILIPTKEKIVANIKDKKITNMFALKVAEDPIIFNISYKDASIITGTLIKKEKRITFLTPNPKSNPIAIVMPDLEMPGKTASAWNTDIKKTVTR